MAATAQVDRFPPQIKFIVGNEGCERFSFYGMKAILVPYMVTWLAFAEEQAVSVAHLFMAAVYFLPLLGGFLSDRFLGKYRTILLLSIVYCVGHLMLAIGENQTWGLYWGLGLIALGAGGIKPCVSSHVGDQFTAKNRHLVTRVFGIFYWMINFGSFFSTLMIPEIYERHGPGWAFGIPGVLMAIATVVFWMGRRHYVHVPPTGPNPESFTKVMWHGVRHGWRRGRDFLEAGADRFSPEAREGVRAVLRVGGLFLFISVFWALFDQHGSSWLLQAEQMDRRVGFTLFGWTIEKTFSAAQISAVNPIFVMMLIPVLNRWLYPAIERRGIAFTPLRRITAGMFLAGFSFVACALIQAAIQREAGAVHVAWQLLPYFIITVAEVLISITGLEFAYTQAPRAMKGTIMSLWLLTTAVGNLLTSVIAQLNFLDGPAFFVFFAVLMGVAAVLFALAASRYVVRDYMEPDEAPVARQAFEAAAG